MSYVLKYEINKKGRDFAVGDVHGCYDTLMALLAIVNFNPLIDRLFLPGDFVDRGWKSLQMVLLLLQEWANASRGNHEHAIIAIAHGRGTERLRNTTSRRWFFEQPPEVQRHISGVLEALPFAMEVMTKNGLVGLVHAEPLPNWTEMVKELEGPMSLQRIKELSSRLLHLRERHKKNDHSIVEGVHRVIVGHAIHGSITEYGNVLYIDTGAGKGRTLSMVDFTDGIQLYSHPVIDPVTPPDPDEPFTNIT